MENFVAMQRDILLLSKQNGAMASISLIRWHYSSHPPFIFANLQATLGIGVKLLWLLNFFIHSSLLHYSTMHACYLCSPQFCGLIERGASCLLPVRRRKTNIISVICDCQQTQQSHVYRMTQKNHSTYNSIFMYSLGQTQKRRWTNRWMEKNA